MAMDADDFTGCKLALLFADTIVVYQRDNHDGIPFPGLWDLPGGGREGDETPEQCVLRELAEEFSINLSPQRLDLQEIYRAPIDGRKAYFFTAQLLEGELRGIKLGGEGRCWQLMSIAEFVVHEGAIPHLRDLVKKNLPDDCY